MSNSGDNGRYGSPKFKQTKSSNNLAPHKNVAADQNLIGVTKASPSAAGLAGGTAVAVSGSGFAKGAALYFGSKLADKLVVESDTLITAMLPSAGEAATVPVTVVNPDGSQFMLEGAFTYVPLEATDAAQVYGVSPLAIVESEATQISLEGRNLNAAFKNGLIALRGPERAAFKMSSVEISEPDALGIETMAFELAVIIEPPLKSFERIVIQVLASQRANARDDLLVESSRQMFTVIPRDVPVPLAYSPALASDKPGMVVVLGENLAGCTLAFDGDTQVIVQSNTEHSLMAIAAVRTTAPGKSSRKRVARPANSTVSVLDQNGALVGRYALSRAPGAQSKISDPIPPYNPARRGGEGSAQLLPITPPTDFAIDIVPVPDQQAIGPTEKNNVIFDLRDGQYIKSSSNISNFVIQIYQRTIRIRLLDRVYLLPFFDAGGRVFNAPIIAKLGQLFPVRAAGILIAARITITVTVTVYAIIGIVIRTEQDFLPSNEFGDAPANAIGFIIIGFIIEVEIIFDVFFMVALILPDGQLRIIFLFQLRLDFDFTISSDGLRLSFVRNITHSIRFLGITPFNELLPCGGRFQLADDEGQTSFADGFGGHLSYYFARSSGECCVPWRFGLELLRFSSERGEEVQQPAFDASVCINAEPRDDLIDIVITSVPPPQGIPSTLLMNLADTATISALAVPVDQNGNPTGASPRDVRDLGYGVEFYLDTALDVLLSSALLDGNAIAVADGSNLIRARLTSVRVIDEAPALAFWQGAVLGFDIIRFIATGQSPRIRPRGLPVTVNPNASAVSVTLKLAYRDSNNILVEAPQSTTTNEFEIVRPEPHIGSLKAERKYVLAAKITANASITFPRTFTFKVTGTQFLNPLAPESRIRLGRNRHTADKAEMFFSGTLVEKNRSITTRKINRNELGQLIEIEGFDIAPNRLELGSSTVDTPLLELVPPGKSVVGTRSILYIAISVVTRGPKISLNNSNFKFTVANDENIEEYLRSYTEVENILNSTDTQTVSFHSKFSDSLSSTLYDVIAPDKTSVETVLEAQGKMLWAKSANIVQGMPPASVPYTDDRLLYWARLRSIGVIKSYLRSVGIQAGTGAGRVDTRIFEFTSRGLDRDGILRFDPGIDPALRKSIVTGFDPFGLFGLYGDVKRSNPSGLNALDLEKTILTGQVPVQSDKIAIRSAVFPVRFEDFNVGMVETAIGATLNDVAMILTVSENGGEKYYDLERWAARHRAGDALDNNNIRGDRIESIPMAVEWLESSLPSAYVVTRQQYLTGPLDARDPQGVPFVIDQSYRISRLDQNPLGRRDPTVPDPSPVAGKFRPSPLVTDAEGHADSNNMLLNDQPMGESDEGSGSNFLSNEIFYRVAIKREGNKVVSALPAVPATGHFHIPSTGTDPISPDAGAPLLSGTQEAITELSDYAFRLVSVKKLKFDPTPITRDRELTIEVYNNSHRPIVISRLSIGAPFSITTPIPTGLLFAPGSTKPFTLKFTAITIGDFSGIFKLYSDVGELVLAVRLEGRAVPNLPPPTITNFSPRLAFFDEVVTVNGANFSDVTGVFVGNSFVDNFTVISDRQISFVADFVSGRITVSTLYGSVTSSASLSVRLPPI